MCTSHHDAPNDLYKATAAVLRHLCSEFIDPDGLSACRPIALDQNPGVRPIEIGETLCSIIARAVFQDGTTLIAAGLMQLCAGQESGCEAAVHVCRNCLVPLKYIHVGAVLLDVSNAFNSLNRQTVYGTVSSKITLMVLYQNFQDKQKKSNARIEMYG